MTLSFAASMQDMRFQPRCAATFGNGGGSIRHEALVRPSGTGWTSPASKQTYDYRLDEGGLPSRFGQPRFFSLAARFRLRAPDRPRSSAAQTSGRTNRSPEATGKQLAKSQTSN